MKTVQREHTQIRRVPLHCSVADTVQRENTRSRQAQTPLQAARLVQREPLLSKQDYLQVLIAYLADGARIRPCPGRPLMQHVTIAPEARGPARRELRVLNIVNLVQLENFLRGLLGFTALRIVTCVRQASFLQRWVRIRQTLARHAQQVPSS